MHFAISRRTVAALFTVALAAMTAALTAAPTQGARATCAPLDLAFVVDTTGSMGSAIGNVKSGLNRIISQAKAVSGGNYRFGLVSVPGEEIVVNTPFADRNDAAVKSQIDAFSAGGGGNFPEDTDGAVQTVVEARRASDVPGTPTSPEGSRGPQTGDFQPPFRAPAEKIIVLVTDAQPSGGDDSFEASDTTHVQAVAAEAKSKGIRIAAIYVPTSGVDPAIRRSMRLYASGSGGEYRQTSSTGSGVAASIRGSIISCGGKFKPLKVRSRPRRIPVGVTTCVR